MGQLSSILRDATDNTLMFWCPGCNEPHAIQHGQGAGPRWGWNNDALRPTFTPSVLVRSIRNDLTEEEYRQYDEAYAKAGREVLNDPRFASCCHSFVTNGRIQFLTDSTHHLAGQTVDLPPWPRREEA